MLKEKFRVELYVKSYQSSLQTKSASASRLILSRTMFLSHASPSDRMKHRPIKSVLQPWIKALSRKEGGKKNSTIFLISALMLFFNLISIAKLKRKRICF